MTDEVYCTACHSFHAPGFRCLMAVDLLPLHRAVRPSGPSRVPVRGDGVLWHGVPTGMAGGAFSDWRQWMILHEPTVYFAWARVLARQEVEREDALQAAWSGQFAVIPEWVRGRGGRRS